MWGKLWASVYMGANCTQGDKLSARTLLKQNVWGILFRCVGHPLQMCGASSSGVGGASSSGVGVHPLQVRGCILFDVCGGGGIPGIYGQPHRQSEAHPSKMWGKLWASVYMGANCTQGDKLSARTLLKQNVWGILFRCVGHPLQMCGASSSGVGGASSSGVGVHPLQVRGCILFDVCGGGGIPGIYGQPHRQSEAHPSSRVGRRVGVTMIFKKNLSNVQKNYIYKCCWLFAVLRSEGLQRANNIGAHNL